MSKNNVNLLRLKSIPLSNVIVATIPRFSLERRNIIRGIVAAATRQRVSAKHVNIIRNNDSERDMLAAARILESPNGLRNRSVKALLLGSVSRPHELAVKSAKLEAAYASAYLNAWHDESQTALKLILRISNITGYSDDLRVQDIVDMADIFGASNYLVRKIAYLKEYCPLTAKDEEILDNVGRAIGQDESPSLYYSALETIKRRMSIFSAARRHASVFKSHDYTGFRRNHNLNNLVCTPFSEEDCAGFLLRSVETSLIDTIFSIQIILNMEDRFPEISEVIKRILSSTLIDDLRVIRDCLSAQQTPNLLADHELVVDSPLIASSEQEDRSESMYRRSAVFLEYPQLCKFRNDIDRVVGRRLVSSLEPSAVEWTASSFERVDVMKRADSDFELELHGTENVKIDMFYRTFLFLRFVQDSSNLASLKNEDIKYIFNNTSNLESLLLERELKSMHLNASDEARALISVLALALYRSKSADPDVDYDFRKNLEDYIISNFNGDINLFIDHIAPEHAQVANYLATSLDEPTLQKMYSLIDSVASAQLVRRSMLTTIGKFLNRIEYIIEAEGIETRAKVAKIKEYFDASRMYVDSIAMRNWLISNPSAYLQKYKELLPEISAAVERTKSNVASDKTEENNAADDISKKHERFVQQIASDAFREFCTNNEFGIESYLARRIRHNTLLGVMTSCVDAVLKREQYGPIVNGTPFGKALAGWEAGYRVRIERMRKDLLQFKSDGKPNALFNPVLDVTDPSTRSNLQQLLHNLVIGGAELVNDLLISFCWQQIAPQLESTARYIRLSLLQEVTQSLDQALTNFKGTEEEKVKAELLSNLSTMLSQVASWFQIPQTGFVPASISEICNIIDIDNGRPASSTRVHVSGVISKYYGITVHRIYDCLAVLLHNAFKHGKADADVCVEVSSSIIDGTNFHQLDLSVISTLPTLGATSCLAMVEKAIMSTESSKDLVTEGYSGLKKVKVITRLNEGESTVSYSHPGDTVVISLRLKAEVVSGEHASEENFVG